MPDPSPRGYAARLAAPRRRERYGQDAPARPATAIAAPAADAPSPGRSRPPQGVAIPHHQTFASIVGAGLKMYRSYFDEAIRANYRDAMAVRKDLLIDDAMRQRKIASAGLPWEITPDDPKDPEQKKVAARVEKILRATRRFQAMRMYLGESTFFGKYGAQLAWDRDRVDGQPCIKVVSHKPINGDKIVYGFDDTPGILVHAGYRPAGADIRQQDRGRALMLSSPEWRDRVVIQEFEPADMDFLTQGDMAASVHGLGMRSWLWFFWQIRNEFMAWGMDGAQRIGTNGQLYGFYPAGNADARDELIRSLQMLVADGVTAFEANPGDGSPDSYIKSIPSSGIANDVIMRWIEYCDSAMRRSILGQSLTSETGPTGLAGGKVAEAHESTFERYVRFDATNQDEALTDQLVGPCARFNYGDIGFGLRFKTLIDKEDGLEDLQKAQILHGMNVPIDLDQLREKAGFSAPKVGDAVLPGAPEAPGGGPPRPGTPPPTTTPGGPPRPRTNAPDGDPPATPAPRPPAPDRARYAAEHAPHTETIGGKEYKGGQFVPGGDHDEPHADLPDWLADVADHHRKIAFKLTPRVSGGPRDEPITIDGDQGPRPGHLHHEWSAEAYGDRYRLQVIHDPGHRADDVAEGGDVEDIDHEPYHVRDLSRHGTDVSRHATLAEAMAEARDRLPDWREYVRDAAGYEGEAVVPRGESLRTLASVSEAPDLVDRDPGLDYRFRERNFTKEEAKELAERDREDFHREHADRFRGDKDGFLAAWEAHRAATRPAARRPAELRRHDILAAPKPAKAKPKAGPTG